MRRSMADAEPEGSGMEEKMAERLTGHTELIGLMAYPIRHSSSPAMHNEAFAYLGLDYEYLALRRIE